MAGPFNTPSLKVQLKISVFISVGKLACFHIEFHASCSSLKSATWLQYIIKYKTLGYKKNETRGLDSSRSGDPRPRESMWDGPWACQGQRLVSLHACRPTYGPQATPDPMQRYSIIQVPQSQKVNIFFTFHIFRGIRHLAPLRHFMIDLFLISMDRVGYGS